MNATGAAGPASRDSTAPYQPTCPDPGFAGPVAGSDERFLTALRSMVVCKRSIGLDRFAMGRW